MPVAEVLFCPLAGINCNIPHKIEVKNYRSFRPLAGINCNIMKAIGKLSVIGFRPLEGCSFTIPHIESKEKNYTPEKRGWSRKDKA